MEFNLILTKLYSTTVGLQIVLPYLEPNQRPCIDFIGAGINNVFVVSVKEVLKESYINFIDLEQVCI